MKQQTHDKLNVWRTCVILCEFLNKVYYNCNYYYYYYHYYYYFSQFEHPAIRSDYVP